MRRLAHIYIDRRVSDLCNLPTVIALHGRMPQGTVEKSLKLHVDRRVEEQYPAKDYGREGGHVPPEIVSIAVQQQRDRAENSTETAFDMKQ